MTLPEFLEKLEQTPRDWYLLRNRIRRGNCYCPLIEVSGMPQSGYYSAAWTLGLSSDLRDRIVAAADNSAFYGPLIPELRAKLLKACGLEAQS